MRHKTLPILFCLYGSTAMSQDAEQRYDQTFAAVATSTRFSLIDIGGSKGSYGTNVGVGVTRTQTDSEESYINELYGLDEQQTDQQWVHLTATKGTRWPVDFGLGISQLQGTSVNQLSGIIQATVFERFGWPAVTIRFSKSQAMGLPSKNSIDSQNIEVIATKGIWRYFTGTAAIGTTTTNATIAIQDEEFLGLSSDGVLQETRQTNSQYFRGGLMIQLWPPFLNVVGEATIDSLGQSSMSGKLTWLI